MLLKRVIVGQLLAGIPQRKICNIELLSNICIVHAIVIWSLVAGTNHQPPATSHQQPTTSNQPPATFKVYHVMIKAITFDFWDTLVFDNSDEPKRAAQGLGGKAETRLRLLTAEIRQHNPAIPPEQIEAAFVAANGRFRHYWKTLHTTPNVASRLSEAYTWLGIDLTPGFHDLVRAIEFMEVEIPPDFLPDVAETLAALAQNYKLGVISDAIHTPGRGLRQMLRREGLLSYFSHWVFSDEAGASKPDPAVFEKAAAGLDVAYDEIVHIGDRESNDIAGPLAMGMKAILITAAVDRDSANTQATAVCPQFSDLPALIQQICSPIL